MRKEFWKELNEARSKGTWQLWKNAFPEASALDMTCLVEINQYISISGGKNAFIQNQSLLGPVQHDTRVKPFYTEFVGNYDRIASEINWSGLFFFSLSDQQPAFEMHSDEETVILIQGYGEVGMITRHPEEANHHIHHMKTGDTLLLPPGTIHKPVPLGPRVTLSLGALPENTSSQGKNRY